jgi:hypothetical protein
MKLYKLTPISGRKGQIGVPQTDSTDWNLTEYSVGFPTS